MKTEITPGPWRLVYTDKGELELSGGLEQSTGVYSDAGFGLIANVIYKKTNILGDSKNLQAKTFEANAKLISAAPALLEALLELSEQVTRDCSIGSDPRFYDMLQKHQKAIMAIKKATE